MQEAKQRFSEVLRAVKNDGPQTITRHGEDVAVVMDFDEYRRLTGPQKDLKKLLLGPPYFDDEMVAVMDEIEEQRRGDFPRQLDLGAGE